ncbi:amidase domain-containing protein [Agromyces aerolatus]|uniref:amidase domain-containing protein n=1 Tax=Agromyces sp. LY-1074 TaxID=3074080 RepID=UPI0028588A30|nr:MULTISPECIES: amidase domain-containing protein [unclassified Agromyces]MDR5699486.1 amidase domain-containing protein [Agromyces sp. LY-1074]MDR5705782.1 amidase domain-containing protein [Agromyces sp. LY-1358]
MSKHHAPRTIVRRRLLAVGAGAALLVGVVGVSIGAAVGGVDESPGDSAASKGSISAAAPKAEPEGATSGEASAAAMSAPLSPAVAAQLAYVEANWQATSNEEFGFLEASDCVNFASQSLLDRGWQPDDEWWYEAGGDPYAHASAWISSTAFRDYLAARPDRATALTDDQRDQVKVGDIVQFDWDNSGDRDHTGIVTGVITLADGTISIEYAGHTDPTFDFTVDEAITVKHPGGTAYYWSIPE